MGNAKTKANVNVDVLGIWKKVEGYFLVNRRRESWVKNARDAVFHELGESYNVLVFNLSQKYEWTLKEGVVFYRGVRFGNDLYGIWGFESGEFDNLGDSGFDNWAFEGKWKRSQKDGKHVSFQIPEELEYHIVPYAALTSDILPNLARRYGCTEDDILGWNKISMAEVLPIGTKLRIRDFYQVVI